MDHTEYRVPRSFMCDLDRVVHGPTPAGWPKGGMLSSAGESCLSLPQDRLRELVRPPLP